MKNKIIYFIGILILFFTIISVYSQGNWIQTTIGNKFGIWAPNKNTNQAPNLAISEDNKIGLALNNINSLDSSDFKSGDVVANRYCFENSKECVTTFQQGFTNSSIFSPALPNNLLNSGLVKDSSGNKYINKNGESFFITFNKKFIDIVGMDPNYGTGEFRGQQATNWFDFGYSYLNVNNNSMRSIWLEEGDNFSPSYTTELANGYFVAGNNKALVYCTIRNQYGINNTTPDYGMCTNPSNNVLDNRYCNTSSKMCGRPTIQVRLTQGMGDSECIDAKYHPILSFYSWGAPSIFSMKSTGYSNYNPAEIPAKCLSNTNPHAKLQMRVVMDRYFSLPAQSLSKFFQNHTLEAGVGRFGIINVR